MYQTMSPDNMTSTTTTNIRKSNMNINLKSNKEENVAENGRISSSYGNSTPPTTTTTTTFDGNDNNNNNNNNGLMHNKFPHQHHQDHHHQASSSSAGHESSPSRSPCIGGGDMLLQWGPRKRSRCSRTEGRSMVSLVLDKHSNTTNNHIMPPPPSHPPSTSSNASRIGSSSRARPHGLLYGKDSPAFLSSKNRNPVDQMGASSASPSRNGGSSSRPISRSTVGKRSPSCVEKNESNKKVSSSSGTIRKVKSDDSLVPSGNGNHHDSANGDHGCGPVSTMVRSPVADAEKASELIEWPRIYLSLSRKEKEDDFYAMKGTKLPHRPKKRAKAVDRALQYCFPGLWLSDLTRARYEVRERKSAKKPKRRGLKGLENMESESE